jgi:hypothetical protein
VQVGHQQIEAAELEVASEDYPDSLAFIIAAIVAPEGDCSMAMTRDCFEPALLFFGLCSPDTARTDGLAVFASVWAA